MVGGYAPVNLAHIIYNLVEGSLGSIAANVVILPYTVVSLWALDPQATSFANKVELVQREGIVSAGRMKSDPRTNARTFTVENYLTGRESSVEDSDGNGLVDKIKGFTQEEAQQIFDDAVRRYDLRNPKKL